MTHNDQINLFVRSLSLLDVDDDRIVNATEVDMTAILQATEQLANTTPPTPPQPCACTDCCFDRRFNHAVRIPIRRYPNEPTRQQTVPSNGRGVLPSLGARG